MNKHFCTRKELAERLGISYKTLYRYMKAHELEIPNKYLNPQTQKQIIGLICPGLVPDKILNREEK